MSILATGIIYFKDTLSDAMYDDISYFIGEAANKNRIGINMSYNLSDYAMSKYKTNGGFVAEKSTMIYELTESPWWSQSENLFAPVIYNDKGEGVGIDLSRSRLPGVQKFFSDILDNDNVSEILFSLREGNPAPDEFEKCKIHVGEFCETISDAYKKTKTVGEAKTTPNITVGICR
ncbi:MAG: hypothetical protein GX897_05355 [Clostridiales bacterium]|nr:hypothetical protein [Clostridiales bacterium]